MRNLFQKASLRFRLNLFCMGINFIVILCIAAGIGFVSNWLLKEQSVSSLEMQAENASERLNALLDRVENASLHFVVNEAYKETYESQDQISSYDSYLFSSTISSHLLEFLSVQKDIYSMAFFTYDGKQFFRAMNEDTSVKSSPGQEELINRFLKDGYTAHWYIRPMNGRPQDAEFIFVRKMFNLNGKLRGILSLTLADESVTGLFSDELPQNASYALLFDDARYSPKSLSGSNTSITIDSTQLIVTKPYDRLSASTATLVSKASVNQKSYILVLVIIVIGCFTQLLSALVFHKATKYFLTPLELILSKVAQLSKGDYSTRIHAAFHDELGNLADQIDHMAENTQTLMVEIKNAEVKKKEYEVFYLQMQMRPHFLYNTLQNLCGMISIGERENAISMINDISAFYRGVLNQGDAVITLKKELEISENYMRIMAKRYPGLFTWTISTEETVLLCNLPKLTLQPLLENAILHGFAARHKEGHISIIAAKDGQQIQIRVKDSGCGMTAEQLSHLVGESCASHTTSFGIRSIEERLRLYLGESAGLTICSSVDSGTEVVLYFSSVFQETIERKLYL